MFVWYVIYLYPITSRITQFHALISQFDQKLRFQLSIHVPHPSQSTSTLYFLHLSFLPSLILPLDAAHCSQNSVHVLCSADHSIVPSLLD